MRKSNSEIKTSFVSESGTELVNNDYFAYVEYDDYACYVLASGITDFESSEAAKEVVENLILNFEEHPSMDKGTLMNYMRDTNQRLLSGSHIRRLKASVMMLVTNYEKFRYAAAGNVRLRMYRKGIFYLESSDMSLANDLIKSGESETPLDRHEERHNLYAYFGKKDSFNPYISKIEKLADGDIISLYSQGLWEHVDSQEIDEIFTDATDNPQESVDLLEDILLSRQPAGLKSYTIVAIFVNKVFQDPEREKKRKRNIKIALIVLVIAIIIAIVVYIVHRVYENKLKNLQDSMAHTQEYIAAENYKRAQVSAKEAAELAHSLDREDDEETMKNSLQMLDNLVQADDFFNSGNYNSAYDEYIKAQKYTPNSEKNIRDHIRQRLTFIENRMDMDQFMTLGDNFFQEEDFDNAEAMYRKAGEQAANLHDKDARQKALDALEKVYDKRAALRKDANKKIDDKKKVAMSDAMKKGDDLLAAGDLEGAQKAYLDARNLSDDPADRAQISAALGKVSEAKEKKQQEEDTSDETRKKEFDEATKIEVQGDTSYNAGDYVSAQMYYMMAIEKFSDLGESVKVQAIQSKFAVARAKSLDSQGTKVEAEDTEQRARNFYAEQNFEAARTAATKAKELYTKLGMKSKVDDMDVLLTQIATDEMISDSVK